jgi:hypothetical protein
MTLYRIDLQVKFLRILNGFPLELFLAELWPLNEKGVNKVCPDYSPYKTTNVIQMKLYRTEW